MGIVETILFVASTAYQISQQNKMKKKQQEAAANAAAEADKRRGSIFGVQSVPISLPVVYGRQIVGGTQFDHKVSKDYIYAAPEPGSQTFLSSENALSSNITGTKNEFLFAKHAICHAGINGVKHVLVNNKAYYHNDYVYGQRIVVYPNGGLSLLLTSNKYPISDRFTNVAYAAEVFRLDREKQNYSGAPDVQYIVEGQKIRYITYQNGIYSLSDQKVYSNNPAYVLLDYLTNNVYGKGLSDNEIDLESFYKSAQVCATIVATNVEVAGHVWGSKPISNYPNYASFPNPNAWGYEDILLKDDSTNNYYFWRQTNSDMENPTGEYVLTTVPRRNIPLYECNITINTERPIRDNIEDILNTMHYAELVWSTDGKYKLLVEYPKTDTEIQNLISHNFNKDNIIRDSIFISFPSASDRLNFVTVDFLNEHENFKQDTVSWPTKGSSVYNSYLAEDNYKPLETSISPLSTDPYHALAKAEQLVRSSRSAYNIVFTTTKYGLTVEPGDFITVELDEIGLDTPTIFRVEEIKVNSQFNCEITAYKFNYQDLAWNVPDTIAYNIKQIYTTIVDPVYNIQVFQNNLKLQDICRITWDYEDDQNGSLFTYEIYYKPSSATSYIYAGETKDKEFFLQRISGIETNTSYDFYIKVRSFLGNLSVPKYLSNVSLDRAPNEPFDVKVVDELYLTNNASGVKSRAVITWDPDLSGIKPAYYNVQYKLVNQSTFINAGNSTLTRTTINDLAVGDYIFRVTPVSINDFAGNYIEIQKLISGLSVPPADPTNFSGNINEGQINLSWDLPTDLDVLYGGSSEIRYHAATGTQATWDSSSILVNNLSGNTNNKTVPTLKGTFLIKFKDSTGNYSNNPAVFVSTFEDLSFNQVESIDEDSVGFTGTKVNCSVVNNNLEIDNNQTSMTYDFHDYVDLGEIVTVRTVPYVDALVFESGVLVSNYGNISQLQSFLGPVSFASIQVFVSTTTDDPAGNPTWSNYQLLTIGSFRCRALRFKLQASVQSPNTKVVITNLGATIDKKDVIKTGSSTSSTTGDTTVTFNTPFYGGPGGTNSPTIGIQIIGGQLNDQPFIVSRDKDKFIYSVYNNGNRVQRNIDWQAIGQ